MAVLWRDRDLKDAADDDTVLWHVVVVLVPTDWRAFDDERGHGQCLDQVNITKRARSANVTIAATSAASKLLTYASLQRALEGANLRRLYCLRTQIGLFGFPSALARTERRHGARRFGQD